MALALALALLAVMLVPSLLAASGDRPAGTDEAAGEASTEAEAGAGNASREAEGPVEETEPATPGIGESIVSPPGGDPDRGETAGERAGDDVPASDAKADEPAASSKGNRRAPGGRGSRHEARAAGSSAVDIRDFAYSPREITVRVGDVVLWTNRDREPHDAEAFDGSFKTRVLEQGQSDSVTFRNAGTFRYFCSIHPPSQFPDFTGTVRVVGAGDGPGGAAATDDPASGTEAGDEAQAADPEETTGQRAGERRGVGLPATGLGLLPLLALGLALLSTGALARRLARIGRRGSGG